MSVITRSGVVDVVTITTDQIFPATKAFPGTIYTSGLIVNGIGTKFSQYFTVGDYLIKPSTLEVRKVVGVIDDVTMRIDAAFAANILVGSPEACTSVESGVYQTLIIEKVGDTGTPTIDGVALALPKELHNQYGLGPVVIKVAGATLNVTTIR